MSDQYDDTNKGVMFPPYNDQRLVLQGKLNIEGNEKRIIALRQPLKKGGDPVLVVYEMVGVMYANDKAGNDRAPDWSGPLDQYTDLRVAGWKGEKNGTTYLSLKVSQKQSDAQETPSRGDQHQEHFPDDEIPF